MSKQKFLSHQKMVFINYLYFPLNLFTCLIFPLPTVNPPTSVCHPVHLPTFSLEHSHANVQWHCIFVSDLCVANNFDFYLLFIINICICMYMFVQFLMSCLDCETLLLTIYTNVCFINSYLQKKPDWSKGKPGDAKVKEEVEVDA